MVNERKLYRWEEIEDTPIATGVYAWYYRHSLSDFDINELIKNLKNLDAATASARVSAFLQNYLFESFVEEPYEAALRGPLKPTYQGKLDHVSNISRELVGRIVDEPTRLWEIKKILVGAAPEFASPIYIGMAVSLRVRLKRHKFLIERYMGADLGSFDNQGLATQEISDHSFAREVVRRRFLPNGLAVAVRIIDAPEKVHVDVENILNRINFPLCGRN